MKLKNLSATFIAVFLWITVSYGQLAILSGSDQASFYQFAEDIVKIVGPDVSIKLSNKATYGANDNFDQLVDPKSPYKLAILQSDNLYNMQAQDMLNNTSKTNGLYVVVPLGYDEIHIVTKSNKGITRLQDLSYKTVAIGTTDQGTYTTANIINSRSKIHWSSKNIRLEDALNDLRMDKIDAFVVVSAAPIEKLNLNPQVIGDKLALITLENFNDWAKDYKADTIRTTDYKWLDHDIPTFSVRSVLVVNDSKLNESERASIKQLQMGIQGKLEQLKAEGHPKWQEINLMDWNEKDWPIYR